MSLCYTEMIKSNKLTLTESQNQKVMICTGIIISSFIVSLLLPFGIVSIITHPMEPIHQFIEELLEEKLTFNSTLFRVMFLPSSLVALNFGNVVALQTFAIAMYYMIQTVCMDALQIKRLHCRSVGLDVGRSYLVTQGFWVLKDDEAIFLYRTQQVLNELLNSFFKSVLISFHHVGCLATVVVLIVFVVRYNDILRNEGVFAYILVFVSMMAPMFLLYAQSRMCGDVAASSIRIRESVAKIMPRRFLMRKFCVSCRTFYIKVSHPFYHVQKDSFLVFVDQALGYVVQLLLW